MMKYSSLANTLLALSNIPGVERGAIRFLDTLDQATQQVYKIIFPILFFFWFQTACDEDRPANASSNWYIGFYILCQMLVRWFLEKQDEWFMAHVLEVEGRFRENGGTRPKLHMQVFVLKGMMVYRSLVTFPFFMFCLDLAMINKLAGANDPFQKAFFIFLRINARFLFCTWILKCAFLHDGLMVRHDGYDFEAKQYYFVHRNILFHDQFTFD